MEAGPILAVALLLRLAGIGDRLSADEGYTWLVASAHDAGAFLDRIAAYENTPPLYYLLTWPLPAGDEAWLRVVSVLAGVGCVAAIWWVVRELAGERAALLSAGALAVAPYAVSFSNYGRGFVLADLGLIVALGGALRRSWWTYAAGAVVAVWSEYDAALFLVALTFAIRPTRAELVRALAPLLTLIVWLPEALRGLDAIDVTKVSPIYPGPSPASLRDLVVRLAFGEHGTADALALRWLQFAAVAAVLVVAFRAAPRVLWVTAAGTLALHAAVALVGPDLFAPRYLTELIPLGAAAVGIWLAGLRMRSAVPVAVAAMAALAIAVFVQRSGRELEPDVAALRPDVAAARRPVVTNSAVIAYYLGARLDRPFGLGAGSCSDRCVVVEDLRVAGGPRPGAGRPRRIGPILVRLPRK